MLPCSSFLSLAQDSQCPPTTRTCPHPGKSTVAAVLSQCFHGDPHHPPQGPCGICLGEGVSFSTIVRLFSMRAVGAPASCAHGFSFLISRADCVSFSSLAHSSIGSAAETRAHLNLLSSGYREDARRLPGWSDIFVSLVHTAHSCSCYIFPRLQLFPLIFKTSTDSLAEQDCLELWKCPLSMLW